MMQDLKLAHGKFEPGRPSHQGSIIATRCYGTSRLCFNRHEHKFETLAIRGSVVLLLLVYLPSSPDIARVCRNIERFDTAAGDLLYLPACLLHPTSNFQPPPPPSRTRSNLAIIHPQFIFDPSMDHNPSASSTHNLATSPYSHSQYFSHPDHRHPTTKTTITTSTPATPRRRRHRLLLCRGRIRQFYFRGLIGNITHPPSGRGG